MPRAHFNGKLCDFLFDDLAAIAEAVEAAARKGEVSDIHMSVRDWLHRREPGRPSWELPSSADRLLWASEELVKAESRDLKELAENLSGVPDHNEALLHVDLLTGIWLGMFFLGIPFNDPWDQARQIIDELGGYPARACFNKAIGDVYRLARRVFEEQGAYDQSVRNKELVVLTSFAIEIVPLGVFELKSMTIPATNILGRLYAWLQLQTCIVRKVPVRYYVRKETWEKVRRHVTATPGVPAAEQPTNAFDANHSGLILGENLHILDPSTIEGTPDCYLGHRGGLYSLGPVSDPQLEGNRISRALSDSYRKRLRQAEEKSRVTADPNQQRVGNGEPVVVDAASIHLGSA